MLNLEVSPGLAIAFLLVLGRIGGLMVFAPFFGSFAISPRIKISLALVFSLALFPILKDRVPEVGGDMVLLLLALAGEVVIGLLLGIVGQVFFSMLEIAGHIMGFQMGLTMANVVDPQTQSQTSVISVFEALLGMIVFLSVNGHHWYIEVIMRSYDLTLPAGRGWGELIDHLIGFSGQMFSAGFKLAAPVALVLLIVDFLLGLIGKAAPQIHVLVVGLPLKTLVGLVLMLATLNILLPFMTSELKMIREELFQFSSFFAN